MDNIFFQSSSIMGVGGTVAVGRPDIFGMRFVTDRAFDVFLAVVLALCLIGVGALRRGPFGRRLVGMSDSPAACSTVGLSLTITKLAVFAFSAGLAGLAGALYGGLNTEVGAAQFDFLFSIAIFVGLTLSGVSLLTGAVLAGLFLAVGPVIGAHIPQIPDLTQLLIGFGVVTIGRNPNGIGRFYDEVASFWNRRQGRAARGTPVPDRLDPAVTALVPPPPAGVTAAVGTEVRSVV
jgi:branched-chain amino acid transport system permease protein